MVVEFFSCARPRGTMWLINDNSLFITCFQSTLTVQCKDKHLHRNLTSKDEIFKESVPT